MQLYILTAGTHGEVCDDCAMDDIKSPKSDSMDVEDNTSDASDDACHFATVMDEFVQLLQCNMNSIKKCNQSINVKPKINIG